MAPVFGPHDPITATEINKAFQNSLWKVGGGRNAFMRLGFAISGGVDSMTLAYLWSQLRLNKPSHNPYVRGFVVDHGLRPGSAEEAQLVAERLEPLFGRRGQVITLNWDKYGGLHNITSIETTARKLRFQALGTAAAVNDIQCILLGHHADDNVETTLTRIANNSTGTGVVGMDSISNVPECFGLYGINNSGRFDRLTCHSHIGHYIGGPEEGGVRIGRPLLTFPKSRLIATCKKAGIEWVEDKTNQDVSLTGRNVVRHMLKTDVLPMALRTNSVTDLIQRVQLKSQEREAIKARLHDATYIRSLDLRSGVMEVYLPGRAFLNDLLAEYPDQTIVSESFAQYFHSLIDCVSPSAVIKLTTVLPIARRLFEEISAGVTECTLTHSSISKVKVDALGAMAINGESQLGFRLHRSSYARNQCTSDKPDSISIACQPDVVPLSRSLHRPSISADNTFLWDGRWWISIQNYSSVPLRIEPLDQEKMKEFRETLHGEHWSKYMELISEAAPGLSRWTIPALVCDDHPPDESMIPPVKTNSRKKPPFGESLPPSRPFAFEIYKYSGETIGRQRRSGNEGQKALPGKLKTIPVYDLNPDLFTSEHNLSRLPESERLLKPIPRIQNGKVDKDAYPKPNGPFIVAIPTMGMFLNSYWAHHVKYDIRYKQIPLTGLDYISRYRMEKPVVVDGLKVGSFVPKVVGEHLEQSNA